MQVAPFQVALPQVRGAKLVLSDIPYNLGFSYGPVRDDLEIEEYRQVVSDFVRLSYEAAGDDAHLLVIHYPEHFAEHWTAYTGNGWVFHQWLTWSYHAHSPMPPDDRLRRSHRAILWLKKGNPKTNVAAIPSTYRNPEDRRVRERMKAGILPRATDVIHVEQVKQGSREHLGYANQMPLALLKPLILATTEPGDLVVDPFSGTGSTARAALSLGRHAWGCDANPEAARFWGDLETRQVILASHSEAVCKQEEQP